MGVKTERGLLLKLSSSEKEGLLERGGLIEDLRYRYYWFFPSQLVKKVNSASIVCNMAIQSVVYFTYYLGLPFAMSMCKLTKG